MRLPEWTLRAKALVEAAGLQDQVLTVENFLDYADRLRDIIFDLPKKEQDDPTLRDFAMTLRRLRDDFEDEVSGDPMCVYKPKHSVARAFHQSQARIRYYFGAYRTAKTTSGMAEVYWTVTGQHPYRPQVPQPAQVAIVGVDYAHYAPMVFEKKYIKGEGANTLSPVFPEGGKWLYRYDDRKKIIEIACNECAEAGKAGACVHLKRTIILFSDEGDAEAMQGAQYAGIQLDEQIDEEYYTIGRDRIKTVPNSWLIATETPKRGKAFWTQRRLVPLAKSGEVIPETDIPICETFQIDQFQAGLVPHNEIVASMADMPDSQIRVRIFGEPMVSLESMIFDPDVLEAMRKRDVKKPTRGELYLEVDVGEEEKILSVDYTEKTQRQLLEQASGDTTCAFSRMTNGNLRVWQEPMEYTQYIIGADVAHGLTNRDASCADVLRLEPLGDIIQMEQVAQYHGWVNPMLYAEELFKLGLYYSRPPEYYPWLVVERNGPGLEVIQCLIDMGCWFIFQDITSGAQVKFQLQSRYGVGTTIASKPVLISVLQGVVRAYKHGTQALVVHSEETIDEMESYIQEETEKGNVRFLAESGHDDRVMSLAVGAYGVRSFPIFDWERHGIWQSQLRREEDTPDDTRAKRFWRAIHKEREILEQQRREAEAELEMEMDSYGY
jgi:hypothetical protein